MTRRVIGLVPLVLPERSGVKGHHGSAQGFSLHRAEEESRRSRAAFWRVVVDALVGSIGYGYFISSTSTVLFSVSDICICFLIPEVKPI